MPSYVFVCSAGHRTELSFASYKDRPLRVVCDKRGCRKRATYHVGATFAGWKGQGIPDLPEHLNASLGVVVKSRRHLRDIIKRSQDTDRPIAPYDTVNHRSPRWMEKGQEGHALVNLGRSVRGEHAGMVQQQVKQRLERMAQED
jgi:hypothetical protein